MTCNFFDMAKQKYFVSSGYQTINFFFFFFFFGERDGQTEVELFYNKCIKNEEEVRFYC